MYIRLVEDCIIGNDKNSSINSNNDDDDKNKNIYFLLNRLTTH